MEGSPCRLTRSASVVSVNSLARQSFSSQLSRLTCLSLPSTDYLRSKICSLPTPEAISSLLAIGEDILKWTTVSKAVLLGLDAEDDVEWAASGKDSLATVEAAVTSFGEIVRTFLGLCDQVCHREDPSPTSMAGLVSRIESITCSWAEVKSTLENVKQQVEISLEWVESIQIMNDITTELDECQLIAFEIEEERHKTPRNAEVSYKSGLGHKRSNTFDESNMSMVKLDGRMQPLRASLDFLKPRLVSFAKRADLAFPSAILELGEKRNKLETQWATLCQLFSSLKKELDDDHWVASFKSAAAQAEHMMDSIERSLRRVQQHISNGASKEVEKCVKTYYAKRSGYGPPIERVLTMFESHLQSRGTLNGVILRTKSVIQNRWAELSSAMNVLERQLDSSVSDGISCLSVNDASDSGSTAPSEPPRTATPKNTSFKSPTRIPLSTKRKSLAPNRVLTPIPSTVRRLSSFSMMKPIWNSSTKVDDLFPPRHVSANTPTKSSDGLASIAQVLSRRTSAIPRRVRRESAALPIRVKSPLSENGANSRPKPAWR